MRINFDIEYRAEITNEPTTAHIVVTTGVLCDWEQDGPERKDGKARAFVAGFVPRIIDLTWMAWAALGKPYKDFQLFYKNTNIDMESFSAGEGEGKQANPLA